MDIKDLNEKVVIVTGANGGIGGAIAKGFANEGARVIAGYHSEPFSNEYDQYGEQVIGVHGDLSIPDTAQELVDSATKMGGPHVVVNSGGNFLPGSLLEMDHNQFESVVRVHLFGTWYLCVAAIRKMIEAGIRGSIINMTSRTGLRGLTGEANYAAAKAGIAGLTLALAEEVKAAGIRVNAIAPVAWSVRAEILENVERDEEIIRRSNNVLGRPGYPEDIAPSLKLKRILSFTTKSLKVIEERIS